MSTELPSTPEKSSVQKDESINISLTDTADIEKDSSIISKRETSEKTPVSSATNLDELTRKEDKSPVLANDSSEDRVFTEPNEVFNETECVKFAEKLSKIVEELRIGRANDKQNELRIQTLMSEKNDLERLRDDEALKKQELIQQHNMQQDEARKQFDDQLRFFQENKMKHLLDRESGEQEVKALKDEIRTLHINKYSLEKMIKDQERQIQNYGTTNTNYLNQLAKIENQCKDIFKQCSHVLATVDKVEANVTSSTNFNKKLSFMNEHQNCILATYKQKYEKTKQDLISLQASHVSSTSEEDNRSSSRESIIHLEDELRMHKELCQQVQDQLNNSRQEIQGLLTSLDSAHSLLAKHVETNNKYAESEALLQLELDDLKTECDKYKHELKSNKNVLQEKDIQITEFKNSIEEKERNLNEKIKQLQKENERISKEKQSAEELSSTWSEKIVEQKHEMDSMKGKMTEMETSMKELRLQMEAKNDEVETLEEKLKSEATRYKNLLKNAEEEQLNIIKEVKKWKERTTVLLQNEQKLKDDMNTAQKNKKMSKPQNQYTQTEIVEKESKETNTDGVVNETEHFKNMVDHQAKLQEESTSALEKDINYTHSVGNILPMSTVQNLKQDQIIESKTNPINNNYVTPPSIRNESQTFTNQQEIIIATASHEPVFKKIKTSLEKSISPNVNDKVKSKDQKHSETEEVKTNKTEDFAPVNNDFHLKATKDSSFSTENSYDQNVLLGINSESTPCDKNSKATTKSPKSAIQPLKECSMIDNFSKTNVAHNIKRAPIPTDQLLEATNTSVLERFGGGSTVDVLPDKTKSGTSAQADKTLFEIPNSQKQNTKSVSVIQKDNTLPNWDFDQNHSTIKDTTSQDLKSQEAFLVIPSQRSHVRLESIAKRITSSDENIVIQPSTFTVNSHEVSLPGGMNEVIPNSQESQGFDRNISNRIKSSVQLAPGTPMTDQISLTGASQVSMSGNINTTLLRGATESTLSGNLAEKRTPLLAVVKPSKTGKSLNQARRSEEGGPSMDARGSGMEARGSSVEDFCFSEEEDESIPRAIGSQVDRIESFLKSERLRLSKKRKASDD